MDDALRPPARLNHGFTSAGGLLYVHGGFGLLDADGDANVYGDTGEENI